jgi:hypothetical protein
MPFGDLPGGFVVGAVGELDDEESVATGDDSVVGSGRAMGGGGAAG